MKRQPPHYPLSNIKALINRGQYRVTTTALKCAARDFGYLEAAQLAADVLALVPADFYKTMTTYHDPTLWQDVYRPTIRGIRTYLKLQIADENTIVISFKEL
jgi:motility quorum-sensing regulator / GCU-specific mRNA interferase toxin